VKRVVGGEFGMMLYLLRSQVAYARLSRVQSHQKRSKKKNQEKKKKKKKKQTIICGLALVYPKSVSCAYRGPESTCRRDGAAFS